MCGDLGYDYVYNQFANDNCDVTSTVTPTLVTTDDDVSCIEETCDGTEGPRVATVIVHLIVC